MGAPVLSVWVLGNHPHVKDTTTRKLPGGAWRKQNGGDPVAAVFAVLAVACAVGWQVRWITNAALILYMLEKGYNVPTKEEQATCIRKIIMRCLRPESE